MSWTIGYVGGDSQSEIKFPDERDALQEYRSRFNAHKSLSNSRGRDSSLLGMPWIAPTGDDAYTLFHGVVRGVFRRKGYSVLIISEPLQGDAFQCYWCGDPPPDPGDDIIFDHECDPFPRKEGLFAIRIAE